MTIQALTIPERSAYELDALAFNTIPAKWIEFETTLFSSKWFDYRFMHPVNATYAYADAFKSAWTKAYSETLDDKAAPYVRVFKSHDVFDLKGAVLTGLWRGRQVADAIGMPYEVFTTAALEETLRFWSRPYLPRPAQVYSARVVDKMVERWEKQQQSRLYFSELDQFRAEHYVGSEVQNDHHEWLFAQAEKRGNRDRILADFVDRGLLPANKVKARYGEEASAAILHFA